MLQHREDQSAVQPYAWHSSELLLGHPWVSFAFAAPVSFLHLSQSNADCPVALDFTP